MDCTSLRGPGIPCALRRSPADRPQPAGRRPPRHRGPLAAAGRSRRAGGIERRRAPTSTRRSRRSVSMPAKVEQGLRAAAARAIAAASVAARPSRIFRFGRARCLRAGARRRHAGARAVAGNRLRAADEETRRFVETLHPEISSEEPAVISAGDGGSTEALSTPEECREELIEIRCSNRPRRSSPIRDTHRRAGRTARSN